MPIMNLSLNVPTPLEYFSSLVHSDADFPLLEAAVSLGQDEYPEMSVQLVLGEVDQLLARLKRRLPADADAAIHLGGLRDFASVDDALALNSEVFAVARQLATATPRLLVTVQDSGPGLSEAQAARLGERFFRVLGTGEAGSGLGWSIVQRIAAAHWATVVTGRSAALGGLSVTVDWPAA